MMAEHRQAAKETCRVLAACRMAPVRASVRLNAIGRVVNSPEREHHAAASRAKAQVSPPRILNLTLNLIHNQILNQDQGHFLTFGSQA